MLIAKKIFLSVAVLFALNSIAQSTVTFNCGGGNNNWTVPPCVTSINVTISGAQGGGSNGGLGASMSGTMTVTPGQVLQIVVGCQPNGVSGGNGGGGNGQNASGAGNASYGGGGASSISIGGVPVVVAGGGGGTSGGTVDMNGGAGGCPNGVAGLSMFGVGGGGGTTTSGGTAGPPWISSGGPGQAGSFMQGGAGGADPCYNVGPGGGGGGGYYGGGGGGSDCFSSAPYGGGGGGGGSSLIPSGFSCAGNHAGSGQIVITYSGGTGTATAANTGPYCAGATIQLTSTGGAPYTWNGPNGFTSTSQNPTIPGATTAAGGVYTVTAGPSGCSATATTTVVVNPSPTVTVNSATICPGGTATLTAAGAGSYNWNPSTGLSGTSGAVVTSTPASTTVYTVTGTTGTCSSTATSTVTVGANVAVTVASATICAGTSTVLTANGATNYTWSPGTGLSSTTGNTVTANPASTTNYTITGATGSCSGTTTATVTVVNNPVITTTSGTMCLGGSTTISASGASSYAWSPSTGLSSSTAPTVTATPTSTSVYTVVGSVGTCTGVATATVTVNPLPVVSIGSNSPLCVNQTLNLTSGGGVGYSWNGPNSFSSLQQNPSKTSVTTADGGVYTVTVTDANGCVNTNTTSVTINPLPVVIATGATVCVNQTINLSCNNSGVSYSWIGPLSYGSNQQNPSIPNATTSMTGTYVVTVTDGNGCVSSNAAQVLVNPALIINASSNTPVCENGTLNLTSTSGVGWTWSGPNNFTSNQQNPGISSVSMNANGTYTVVGTDINGCQGTATTNVVINALPIITANSATICVGQQTATLTANGASSYAWTPFSSLSSNAGTSVTGTPSVSTVYTITGTDANSCVNTGTTSIIVNSLPNVTVNSASICIGQQTATLTANGAGSGTYTWTPNVSLSTPTGSPVTANPTSTITYSVTGIDPNGCYSSATSTVVVNPLPSVTVNSPSICKGKTTTLVANGANTYAWTPPTGLSSSNGAAVSASPSATSTYVVTGTDVNGCVSTATTIVTVNPLPILNVSPSNFSGCVPVCIAPMNTTSVNGTCSWNFGDGTSSTACTPSHCYLTQGTYISILTFTDNNGCVNTDTAVTNAYPMPDAEFTFGPQPTSILDPLIYFVDATSGAPVSTWMWSFGDSARATSTIQNPSFNYQNAGTYNVSLAVSTNKGCKDSVTHTIIVENNFSMYVPNAFSPNADNVNDVFQPRGEGFRDFKMYIYDRWGNLVFFTDDITVGWDGRFKNKGAEVVTEDAYVWKIELKTYKNETKQMSGTVVLIK